MKNNNQKESGAVMMISVIFFIVLSVIILSGLTGPSAREYRVANDAITSRQSYFLAESGAEDAYYRIQSGKQIGSTETLTLNGSTATTGIDSSLAQARTITALGVVQNGWRRIKLVLNSNATVVFKYGTQSGQGGIVFLNGSYLDGTVYSNGNISGSSQAYITGSAYVASSSGTLAGMCVGGVANGSACNVSATGGDIHAHTVTGSNVTGALYCQTGSTNNKACNTSQADPAVEALPVTSANITTWKADAAAGTPISGNYSITTPVTLGPTKITGNLTVSGNGELTINNTIWVTGNVTLSGSGQSGSLVKLSPSFGASSGIIIADGLISIGNGVTFQNSGTAGSYIMLLSTSSCDSSTNGAPCSGTNAIEISNNANIIIAVAQSGTIYFANNATVKEVVANKIRLKNGVGIQYGIGSVTVGFKSGTASIWKVTSWKETP